MKSGIVTQMRAALGSLFGRRPRTLSGVDDRHGWTTLHDFGGMGSWQQDIEINRDQVTANWALFSCMTLVAGDIGKVSINLVEKSGGIWIETESPSFSPVLRKPNGFQTRQQFIECWILSKLSYGNSYILKQRDQRQVVTGLFVLDPSRVLPLVAEDGSVFYQLMSDDLSQVREDLPAVPASEIIHDRFNCLFHPLVGLSPIYANGLAALQGLKIQANSTKFFENMSRPGGILTAPGAIGDDTAARLKETWQTNYSGEKFGRVAVLGDGLKFESMSVTAVDSQMIEQLKATSEMVCSTFHIPPFKIGVGTIPSGQKVEELNQIYYNDCLHALMDAVQTCLSEGLGLGYPIGGRWMCAKFDLDDLLKMDGLSLINAIKTGIDAAVLSPNEGRRKLNLPPLVGGDTVYMQMQDYPLDQVRLNKIQTEAPVPPAIEEEPEADDEGPQERTYRVLMGLNSKSIGADLLQ